MANFEELMTVGQVAQVALGEALGAVEAKPTGWAAVLSKLGIGAKKKAQAREKALVEAQNEFEREFMECLHALMQLQDGEPVGDFMSSLMAKRTAYLGIEAVKQGCASVVLGRKKGPGVDLPALAARMDALGLGETERDARRLLGDAIKVADDPEARFVVREDLFGAFADTLNALMAMDFHQARVEAKSLAEELERAHPASILDASPARAQPARI